jgi:predicted DNA-binding transcriptional regulator AlpA
VSDQKQRSLSEILTEAEVIDLLGIKKTGLDRLRRDKKFPFCKLTNFNRVYLVNDILEFIESKRMVVDRDL